MSRLASILLALALATGAHAAPPPPAPPAPARAEPGPDEPITCTGTLAGAVTGTFSCKVTVSIAGAQAAFRVEPLSAVRGVRTLVPADFALAMPLRPTTYSREAVAGGAAVVELEDGRRYAASARRGEVTLSLESAERYRQARNFYVTSGTLVAHLVGDGTERGEVVIEVRF
jgi:hypothetical protein